MESPVFPSGWSTVPGGMYGSGYVRVDGVRCVLDLPESRLDDVLRFSARFAWPGGQSEVRLGASTPRAALAEIDARWPLPPWWGDVQAPADR